MPACSAGSISASTYPARPVHRTNCWRGPPHPGSASGFITDHLRDNVAEPIEMAIPPRCRLHNRRYMETIWQLLPEHPRSRGKPLALMSLDIDFFRRSTTITATPPAMTCCAEFAVRIRSLSAHRSRLPLWRENSSS